ncbi:MAG: flavin-containing monooxygenase [Acidimicrobiales bacterium]
MTAFTPIYDLRPDDATIRAALDHVEAPLIAALALATSDAGLLRPDLRPDLSNPFDPEGGWTPDQRDLAADVAFEALARLRGSDPADRPAPDAERIRPIVEFLIGRGVDDTYLEFLREELEVEGTDLRAPGWHKASVAPERDFRVGVIGAGMSGLLAAYRMQEAGVDYVVIEKNDDVGGTWLENRYPGCRVDVPNHFFSYSCAQKHDWPELFSSQEVLLDYFRGFADRNGLRPHVRFRTEVAKATWDEAAAAWRLDLTGPDGPDSIEVQAIVVAVGQLNRPKLPDIEGLESFRGPWFHSARWDHGVDMPGKRVAVIGTGCSAAQLIPVVADQASHVDVYQRTPAWFVPTPDYHDEVSTSQRWLFEHVPFYSQWYRFWLFYRGAEALLPCTKVDPGWPARGPAVGEANEMLRAVLSEYVRAEFADTPGLLDKVMPTYPPAGKRIVRDNGIWARTLKRDDVELVTDAIERIDPRGVVTAGGKLHEADIVVYATGFTASDFLVPMTIVGRDGRQLHAQWGGDARAYLGITVPGFPNLFCLYGPNTNIVVNGSIIFFSECEVRYVLGCLRILMERGATSMECRQDVHDDFNARVDEANLQSVWGVATVNSWYRNQHGRTAQNWPFTLLDYWAATRSPAPDDFHVQEAAEGLVTSGGGAR